MPKFSFEEDHFEDETHCAKCGSSDYEVEGLLAHCLVCGSAIVLQDVSRSNRKGKKVKKARFRE